MIDLPVRSVLTAPSGTLTRAVADLDDVAAADDQRLILFRRRAGTVNDTHVRQGNDRRVVLDEAADLVAELRRLRRDCRRQPGHGKTWDQTRQDM